MQRTGIHILTSLKRNILVSLLLPVLISCKDPEIVPDKKPTYPTDTTTTSDSYIHADGILIKDGKGKEIIFKGIGLGGWMLQEGYMLGTSGPQHKIRAFLETLAGKTAVDQFYTDWLNYFVTEEDIKLIAQWGYNSIRLPMHWDLFLDENYQWIENSKGLQLTDNLVRWCEDNHIYLILDLHAAPGSQGNVVDIVDKRDGESLWEDVRFQDYTVEFWRKIASRYADKKWIAGYDLLNEPNYDFENSGSDRGCNCKRNEPLTNLYKRIIDAIRENDKNHLVILEGNCMGGNYNGMEELANYDPKRNLALSFHSYWGQNTQSAIQDKLNLRSKWQVPLWRGEIGENSNTWFTDMVILMDQNHIGWANWPWKKVTSIDGPVQVNYISEWAKVIAYKSNSSNPRPTTTEAQTALTKLIEGIKLQNCRLMPDVAYAWINSPLGEGSKSYATHRLPGTIQLTDYDMGQLRETWYDTDYQNTSGSSSNTAWNKGTKYRNDGVDIYKEGNDYYVGEIKSGEWLQFTLSQPATGSFNISLRYRSNTENGKIIIYTDGEKVLEKILPNTTNAWTIVELGSTNMQNVTKLKVYFDIGGFDARELIIN